MCPRHAKVPPILPPPSGAANLCVAAYHLSRRLFRGHTVFRGTGAFPIKVERAPAMRAEWPAKVSLLGAPQVLGNLRAGAGGKASLARGQSVRQPASQPGFVVDDAFLF